MRWVVVARDAGLPCGSPGGIGAATGHLVRAAAAAGWDVEVITDRPVAAPEGVHVTVPRAAREPRSLRRRLARLRAAETIRPYRFGRWSLAVARELAARPRNVDAVEWPDALAPGFVSLSSDRVREALGAARRLVHAHTPLWLEDEINGVPPHRFGRSHYHAWEREAIARATDVLVPSRALARRIATEAPHALVAPYPLVSLRRGPRARRRAPVVLAVGSLQPRKGTDVLVAAAGQGLARHPRIRLDLVGPDTTATVAGISVHTALAADLGVRTRWLGRRHPAGVRAAIAAARLVVVPSRFESFSLVAAEAILLETPLVVSDACGILEWLPSEVWPPVVPAGSAAALAAGLDRALADPERPARLRARRAALLSACAPARALAARTALFQGAPNAARPGVDELDVMPARLAAMLRGRPARSASSRTDATPALA